MNNYNRYEAIKYAQKWALSRNPQYLNYDNLGGDCTNYISQCFYAGGKWMNFEEYGWYYKDGNNKSPSWTSVEYLYKFLISNKSIGPQGKVQNLRDLMIGDIIQLSFDGNIFGHSLIITKLDNDINKILICAHSKDALNRALGTYSYKNIRGIHVT